MKRIVTHLLVAAGLAAGACGVAQAHTDLSIGLSLGAPVYAQPAPVYVAPEPVYYGHAGWDRGDYYRGDYYRGDYRHDRGWDRNDRHWGHDDRRDRGDDGDRRGGWHG
ncbi:PXPV repeat protein [Paraburkholderia lacunae]|uniref:PXPV repeat-containing protein n=1 Tax=Paraburkholderia lacunae TaxID=2211104 RepID=A0A370N8J4_9BURK|nr:PXPV repeat protein [Paraburkholderia lacunae]RDK01828.1 hypothetical protein DLM46_15805 [Paraburkholderia lacunae]